MTKQEAIQYAVARFSEPAVNYQVLLASSPEVAMDIAESLPGVKELVEIGPEAADAVLNLLRTDGTTQGNNISTIGLYLLYHITTPETTRALAEAVATDQFNGINRDLAAGAFLHSAGIQAKEGDVIEVARREVKSFLESQALPDHKSRQ